MVSAAARKRLFRGIAELIDTQDNGYITPCYLTALDVTHLMGRGRRSV